MFLSTLHCCCSYTIATFLYLCPGRLPQHRHLSTKDLCSQLACYMCYTLLNSPWGFASSFLHLYTRVPLVNLCANKGNILRGNDGCIPMIITLHIPKPTPSTSKLPVMMKKKLKSRTHCQFKNKKQICYRSHINCKAVPYGWWSVWMTLPLLL